MIPIMTMPLQNPHRHGRIVVVSIIAFILSTHTAVAFTQILIRNAKQPPPPPPTLTVPLLFASPSTTTNAVEDTKRFIENLISKTDRGRSVKDLHEFQQINTYISNLELLCPLTEPARDARLEGAWEVLYSDAPPPSNGQLGLFKGVAMQVIDLKNNRYRNELYIGGKNAMNDYNNSSEVNLDEAWLTAVLDAEWAEWDGMYLNYYPSAFVSQNQLEQKSFVDNVDYGATTWKVTFASITFKLFNVPFFTKTFDKNTSRIWKMTYLDDTTRIVRAGRTGQEVDSYLFYMKRR